MSGQASASAAPNVGSRCSMFAGTTVFGGTHQVYGSSASDYRTRRVASADVQACASNAIASCFHARPFRRMSHGSPDIFGLQPLPSQQRPEDRDEYRHLDANDPEEVVTHLLVQR